MWRVQTLQALQAIRLPLLEVARQTGLDKSTIGLVLRGRADPRLSTLHAIEAALRREELRLLAYLARRHPALAIRLAQGAPLPDDAADDADHAFAGVARAFPGAASNLPAAAE